MSRRGSSEYGVDFIVHDQEWAGERKGLDDVAVRGTKEDHDMEDG